MWLSILSDLETKAWTVRDNFFPLAQAHLLRKYAQQNISKFTAADIGRHNSKQTNQEIRSDKTLWFELSHNPELQETQAFLQQGLETLNQNFFTGLNSWECHFAHYSPGAEYKPHFDSFQNDHGGQRWISFILYLNPNWQTQHAGELRIIDNGQDILVEPTFGRFVIFRSDKILHAVNQSLADRLSFTGWYRKNPTHLL